MNSNHRPFRPERSALATALYIRHILTRELNSQRESQRSYCVHVVTTNGFPVAGSKIPSPVLPRKEERVRSDEVETLDRVGGEGAASKSPRYR